MSEPIKVGDLVVQVYDCCPTRPLGKLGIPGIVARIVQDVSSCGHCRGRYGYQGPLVMLAGEPEYWKTPLHWFKRIPPLSELDDVKQDEEITA